MKRLWIVLLALAIVPLLAVPATAQKGGIPGPPDKPNKPDDEPHASVTCVSPWWLGDFKTDDLTISLDRKNPDACVDVLSEVAGQWVVTVTLVDGLWRRPELMMVPRDANWLSDSCGGEKRVGDTVLTEPWILPPDNDARGFEIVPAATVNACPGNAALQGGTGEFWEAVERAGGIADRTDFDQVLLSEGEVVDYEVVEDPTDEIHPLAFVVWSHNLRKGDRIEIHVDLPPLATET